MTQEHYFAEAPTTPADRRDVAFTVWGREFRLVASCGVFSAGRIDPGTAVLLRKAKPPPSDIEGPLLDLGCGYGPIAMALAVSTSSARVYAVDVNERALGLTRDNARRLGVAARVVASRPEEVPGDLRFSQIWSNPPVRIGKPQMYELLGRWLPRLAADGVAWLVASKNLGGDSLHGWLSGEGYTVVRLASQKGFRVLMVTNG